MTPARLRVRPAQPADHDDVLGLLRELELDYPLRDLARFSVAELSGEGIVGIAEVKDLGGVTLLSCVGIREDLQGTGLGRDLVRGALDGVRDDVWLYTLVPGFFAKLGFEDVPDVPPRVPPRRVYGCEGCDPATCRAMVLRSRAG